MGVCSGRLKKGVFGAGTTQKGGSCVQAQLEKGVLGVGQVKKEGGGLPRYTPIGPTHIHMQVPPAPQARHRGVFPIQLCLNSRGGYTGPL